MKPNLKRATMIGILLGLALGLSAHLFTGCTREDAPSPFSFSPDIPNPSSSAQNPSSSTPTSAQPEPPAQGPLEACGLHVYPSESYGTIDPNTLKATVFIAAGYEGPGTVWTYLWDPKVNDGTQYGPGLANQEWSFQVPSCRNYDFNIAGEVDTTGDKHADDNCQDDRFRLKISCSPNPPPPPPPPTCVELYGDGPEIQVNEYSVRAILRNKQGNVVADRTFYRGQESYQSSICVGDLGGENVVAEGCCYPVEVPGIPPPECAYGEPRWNGEGWSCPAPTCDNISIECSSQNIDETNSTITYQLSCNVSGDWDVTNPVELPKLGAAYNKTVTFEADFEQLGCKTELSLHVPVLQCDEGTILREDKCVPYCEIYPDSDECQEHGQCVYEVAKPKKDKKPYCEAKGGVFVQHDGSDHCVFAFPGIVDDKLNLSPGLSDPDCLRKQDDEDFR